MLSTPVLKRFFPLFPSGVVVLLAVLGHLSAPVCLSGVFASAPAWYCVNYLVTIYPFLMEWPFVPSPTEVFGLDRQRIVWLVCLGAGTLVSLTEYAAGWATDSDDAGWAAGYSMHVLSILLFVLFHFHRKRREIAAIEDDAHVGSWLAFLVTVISVLLQLLSSWGYSETRHNVSQSIVIYFLLPLQFIVIFLVDHGKTVTRSYAYLVFYSVLGMRIPDFLAFGSVRMFAQIKDYEHDLLRYAVSFGFLGFMSAYVRMLRTVVHCMGGNPRFLFHAQFYSYCCYYVLISTVRNLDGWFFFMLFGMNCYYVLNNTGMLQEIMRLSDPPAATPQQHQAQLAFQMKIAEQDLTADHASLFAVPMLITAFAFLAGRDALSVANKNRFEIEQIRVEHYDGTPLDVSHLWLRFAIMFVARWLSSQVSKSVFDFKIKATSSSIKQQQEQAAAAAAAATVKPSSSDDEEEDGDTGSDDDDEARRLTSPSPTATPATGEVTTEPAVSVEQFRVNVLTNEFPIVFPYFVLVAVHSLYSIFQNPHLPTRYAFCSFISLKY